MDLVTGPSFSSRIYNKRLPIIIYLLKYIYKKTRQLSKNVAYPDYLDADDQIQTILILILIKPVVISGRELFRPQMVASQWKVILWYTCTGLF